MFYYKKEKNDYYIWSDKIKWQFGPFMWIICKSKYLWDTGKIKQTKLWKEKNFLEKKYSFTKYSFWFSTKKVFVLSEEWVSEILEK